MALCVTELFELVNKGCDSAVPGIIKGYVALGADITTIPAPAARSTTSGSESSGGEIDTDITMASGKVFLPIEFEVEAANKLNVKWNRTTKRWVSTITGKVRMASAAATGVNTQQFQTVAFDKLVKGDAVWLLEQADGPGPVLLGTKTNTVSATDNSQWDTGGSKSDDPNEITLELEWKSSNFPYFYTGEVPLT